MNLQKTKSYLLVLPQCYIASAAVFDSSTPSGYNSFVMLISTEYEINPAHKCKIYEQDKYGNK